LGSHTKATLKHQKGKKHEHLKPKVGNKIQKILKIPEKEFVVVEK